MLFYIESNACAKYLVHDCRSEISDGKIRKAFHAVNSNKISEQIKSPRELFDTRSW